MQSRTACESARPHRDLPGVPDRHRRAGVKVSDHTDRWKSESRATRTAGRARSVHVHWTRATALDSCWRAAGDNLTVFPCLCPFLFLRSARKHVRETAVKSKEFVVGPCATSTCMPTRYSLYRGLPAVCRGSPSWLVSLCSRCVRVQPPLPPPSRASSICALRPPPSTAGTATRFWLCPRDLGLARPAPCTPSAQSRCLRAGSALPRQSCGEWLLIICPLSCLMCWPASENEEGAKVCRQCGQKKSEQKAICGV